MNINFLKKRAVRITKFEKQDKKIFNYVLIYFSIATLITIGLITAEIISNNRLKSIKKQQESIKKSITQSEDLELEFLFFTNKLSFIKEIFDKRSDKQEAISYLTDLFPEEIYISGIEYDEDNEGLSMRVTSKDVFFLETTMDLLNSPEVQDHFAQINKDRLSRDSEGKYTMSLSISLLSQKEKDAKTEDTSDQTTNNGTTNQ